MSNGNDGAKRATRAVRLGMALAVGLAGWAAPFAAFGRPLIPAENRYDYYTGQLPSCADPGVFERIQSRFHARESEFWKSGLEIVGFDRPREIGFRSNGLDYIPRRYCIAEALMNDQAVRRVTYSVAEGLGMIGMGYDVEWCVEGLDRNYAYAPHCKIARP